MILSKYSNRIESLLGATALMSFSSTGRVSFAAPTKDVLLNLVEIQIHFCLQTLIITLLVSEFVSTLSLTASLSILKQAVVKQPVITLL